MVLVFMSIQVLSCAKNPVKPTTLFQLAERNDLYDKKKWVFDGRLALSSPEDSFSLSISWKHQPHKSKTIDRIELAGPFGQGRTIISVTDDTVDINSGERRENFVGNVDDFLSEQVGLSVPVSALKYWVLGLVKPKTDYTIVEGGFIQLGWHVDYQKMMVTAGGGKLPRKIKVKQGDVKLKLIVDRWGGL